MIVTTPFRDDALESTDFRAILARIEPIVEVLCEKNAELSQWYLLTEKQETSLLYEAYEDGQPGRAILAVLGEKYKEVGAPASITLWDGNSNQKQGVILSVSMAFKGEPPPEKGFYLGMHKLSIWAGQGNEADGDANSTVTDFARFHVLSTSVGASTAINGSTPQEMMMLLQLSTRSAFSREESVRERGDDVTGCKARSLSSRLKKQGPPSYGGPFPSGSGVSSVPPCELSDRIH